MNMKKLVILLFCLIHHLYAAVGVLEKNSNRDAVLSLQSDDSVLQEFLFLDRASWMQACAQLPTNRAIMDHKATPRSALFSHPLIQTHDDVYQEFMKALHSVFKLFTKGPLADRKHWTEKGMPSTNFYTLAVYDGEKNVMPLFEPYIEKLDLFKHDKVVFHGDLHGDIHSLLAVVDQLEMKGFFKPGSFTLADPHVYVVFLGDYVDRGYYGVDVLYTLLRLKIANPEQVLLVRGNHEDLGIDMRNLYSFQDELVAKFGQHHHDEVAKLLGRLYNFFPLALYVGHGDNYIQCCHGGVEHGYQPATLLESQARFDLLGTLSRLASLQADNHTIGYMVSHRQYDGSYKLFDPQIGANFLPQGLRTADGVIGFTWFDFAKFGPSFWNSGRGLVADEQLTQAILNYQNKNSVKKVRGIFRAHQHGYVSDIQDPMNLMYELIESKGVYKLWRPFERVQNRYVYDGLVFTFNVAPDSVYGQGNGYTYDTYGILYPDTDYKKWLLSVHNISIGV